MPEGLKIKLNFNAHQPLKESHLILQSTDDNIGSMLQQAMEYLKIETHDIRSDR